MFIKNSYLKKIQAQNRCLFVAAIIAATGISL